MKGYMYILRCADDSYYTGSTNNLERRIQQHQNGEGANFTHKHLPVELIYYEEFDRIDKAFYREKQVQGWSRKKKEALINGKVDKLHELSECKNKSHYKNKSFSDPLREQPAPSPSTSLRIHPLVEQSQDEVAERNPVAERSPNPVAERSPNPVAERSRSHRLKTINMKISIIAGARPNFMKIAPIIEAIKQKQKEGHDIHYRLVHTGQHYDKNMSGSFFEELGIPEPDANLECGGGTQAEQTANVMIRFEKELMEYPADLVLVVGDVTSTLACSIVAKKLCTKVAHIEAGIRSGDLTMPEEINRMVTDSITDYFFTTSEIANWNLKNAGITEDRIFFVGNTMIDTLLKQRQKFRKPPVWDDLGLKEREYLVMTLHRPANVDEEAKLKELMNEIVNASAPLPLIFPVHPRTAKILSGLGISYPRLHKVEPLGYLEFNYLVEKAKAVITDSGGITEETTVMGVPCMTLRDNTERPETMTLGTNELLGTDPEAIKPAMEKLFSGDWKQGGEIPLWDGKTAERIVDSIMEIFISETRS